MDAEETTGVFPRDLGFAGRDDRGACLLVLSGVRAGTAYRLDGDALVGRTKEADIRFESSDVSRCHAHLRFEDAGKWVLADLGSANGTFVNGEPVDERVLEFGDRIEFGVSVVLLFTHYSRVEQRALEAQKLESVGQLAGGVAHDFNNLLTIVRTNLRFIEERLGDHPLRADQIREALADAEAATTRAVELTAQLVGFARGGKYRPETLRLVEVVEEAVRLFRRTFDRAIEIIVDLPRELKVFGDRTQLVQVVMNLGINARDAMPRGGRLEIRAWGIEQDVSGPAGGRQGSFVVLQVKDTGHGMDEQVRARIFEPFFTTKPRGKGTGLGLATVYGIVRNHGGMIDVQSGIDRGTTFRISFPRAEGGVASEESTESEVPLVAADEPRSSWLADPQAIPVQEPWVAAEGPSPGREVEVGLRSAPAWATSTNSFRTRTASTVLLVDDEDGVRDGCARILARRGYRVLHAKDGILAVESYRAHRGSVDVVVLDMVMPRMGGVDTFHALRRIDPGVRVILTSGYTEASGVQDLLKSGAVAFLRKPFDPQALLECVRDAVRHEQRAG